MGNKNIILCFDGTGDWVGTDLTNVAKIFQRLEANQLCFYDGGVGTLNDQQALSSFQRGLLRLLDLALATGMQSKVLSGYSFLVRNYEEGDRIFLFGFSRGAFTARLMAAMIHNFGLLKPQHENLAPYLWQTIAGFKLIGTFKRTANRIKGRFCRGKVPIHFMGLFDTVSSVGVLKRFQTYPNTDFNPSVNRTAHAVSIDERRNCFPESLMHPGQQNLTEVWFPGVHRDAGGGLSAERSRIADEALGWIELEAMSASKEPGGPGPLVMDGSTLPDPQVAPAPNYGPYDPYVIAGFYPMKMFEKRVSAFRFRWPNFRHLRTVPEQALVHEIAFDPKLAAAGYAPTNLPVSVQRFMPGSGLASPKQYVLHAPTCTLADVAGIVLGVASLFLLWNHFSGEPFGESCPGQILWWQRSTWLDLLVLTFVVLQALGQKYTTKFPKHWEDIYMPVCGVAAGAALILAPPVWTLAAVGIGAGAVFALVAQVLTTSPRPADRALPYALWGAIGAGFLYWFVNLIDPAPEQAAWRAELLLAIGAVAGAIDIVVDQRVVANATAGKPRSELLIPILASTLAGFGATAFVLRVILALGLGLFSLPPWVFEHLSEISLVAAAGLTALYIQAMLPVWRSR